MKQDVTQRTVMYDNNQISYTLVRKSVKYINLRIHSDKRICVSASKSVAIKLIDNFVISKGDFILSAIEHFHEIDKNKPPKKQYTSGEIFYILGQAMTLKVLTDPKISVFINGTTLNLAVTDTDNFSLKERELNRYFDEQCKIVFNKIIAEIYPIFQNLNIAYPQVRIRYMKTRWGSCTPTRCTITLNKRLLAMPKELIEYVIMHEFCHFLQPNHSKQFYTQLEQFMPDWKRRKILLADLANKTAII